VTKNPNMGHTDDIVTINLATNFTVSVASHCHDTVSRLVVVYCIGSGGHLYILSNLAVYRSPHSIGPFEYEVSAWRPLIRQTLVCVFARFARCP